MNLTNRTIAIIVDELRGALKRETDRHYHYWRIAQRS